MDHVQDFLAFATPLAIEVEAVYGIPYGVTVAQAALETGWGRSVRGNNYFGIKGAGQTLVTHEYVDGIKTRTTDSFRGYGSARESFFDYGDFLTKNQRYKEAFAYTDDPRSFIREVHKAGYATDPAYAPNVISIMERWGLLEEPKSEEERKMSTILELLLDNQVLQNLVVTAIVGGLVGLGSRHVWVRKIMEYGLVAFGHAESVGDTAHLKGLEKLAPWMSKFVEQITKVKGRPPTPKEIAIAMETMEKQVQKKNTA